MSPRRRIEPGSADVFARPAVAPQRGLLPLAVAVASVVVATAVVLSALVFTDSRAERRMAIRDAAVIDFVRSFIVQYTSPDPFNANAYADKVLAQGTGNFAELYKEKMNDVVIQVAQAEPGFGAVQDIGIERWNEDGSASVITVANMTTTLPDGRKIQSGSRWVVTAVKEGEQWKVSNLIQVI